MTCHPERSNGEAVAQSKDLNACVRIEVLRLRGRVATASLRMTPLLVTVLVACSRPSTTISATGTVEFTETDIAPELNGKLGSLRVHEGDRVKMGDTLAILIAATMPADIARQEAAVADARAQLKNLEAGSRSEEIARAEAEVRRAAAAVKLAQENRQRVEPLAAKGTLPAQRGDEARAAETDATERLAVATQTLRQAQNGARFNDVAAAQARVRQAEAGLAMLRAHAGELTLMASGAGRVRGTWFEPGELVTAGRPVLTVADDTKPWVRVYVGQQGFAQLVPGAKATARLDTGGEAIPGHVVAMSDKAEYTPRVALTEKERADLTFWVKVALDDSTGRVKAGLPITVTFGDRTP